MNFKIVAVMKSNFYDNAINRNKKLNRIFKKLATTRTVIKT